MSKITFRADDDLVARIEALDASKSEVMRDALRTYLDSEARERTLAGDEPAESPSNEGPTTLDDALLERVDELV
ncbi:ribbon-helix-helix protein, CopG family, partial [Halobium palmae]